MKMCFAVDSGMHVSTAELPMKCNFDAMLLSIKVNFVVTKMLDWDVCILYSVPGSAPMIRMYSESAVSITVEWEDLPREDCNGIIVGYKIFYMEDGSGVTETVNVRRTTHKHTITGKVLWFCSKDLCCKKRRRRWLFYEGHRLLLTAPLISRILLVFQNHLSIKYILVLFLGCAFAPVWLYALLGEIFWSPVDFT